MRRQSLMRMGLFVATVLVVFSRGLAVRAAEPPPMPVLVVAVRLHLMESASNPDMQTTLTETDLERILGKVNMIWAQAGIRFQLESAPHTKALDAPASGPPNRKYEQFSQFVPKEAMCPTALNIFYVKNLGPNGFYYGAGIAVKDTAKLKAVPGGLDEPIPRVTAHELGHALGLPHRQDGNNLMASGLNAFLLNAAEIQIAREKAQGIQIKQPTP